MSNTDEHTFLLRFSLHAEIPAEAWEDEDFEGDEWLNEWEGQIKPGLVRAVFSYLRQFEGWNFHLRNRGISPLDEIEIVVKKEWPGKDGKREM
jgi:hypothetical protein